MVYIYVLTNFLFGCDFLIAYSTKKTIFNFYDNKWKKKPRKKNSEETFTETISTITESHDITMLNINSVCPTSWYVNSSSCRSFLCISSLVLIPVDSRCEKKKFEKLSLHEIGFVSIQVPNENVTAWHCIETFSYWHVITRPVRLLFE